MLLSTALSAQNAILDALPVAVDLGGNTKYDGWYNLTASQKTKTIHGVEQTIPGNSGYPGFMGSTNAWPSPIYSQLKSYGETSTVGLQKTANGVAGGPFPSGDSLYYGSFGSEPNTFGGSVGIFEDSPLADLNTILFQVQIGEAWTYDYFVDPVDGIQEPVLTLEYGDGLSATIAADISELMLAAYNGTVEMPTGDEDVFINLYGYQWDVSDYSNISSFSIEFDAVEHAQLYALQLDQSSVDYGTTSMIPQAVPEPGTWALIAGSSMLAIVLVRRRRPTTQVQSA